MTNDATVGLKIDRKAEAQRLRAILRSPEAKALPKLAEHLAYDQDLSAARSIKLMKAALADQKTKKEN